MTEYDYIAIWVGSISLAVLVVMIVAFLVFRKKHGSHHSKKEHKSKKMKDLTPKKNGSKLAQAEDMQTKKITPVTGPIVESADRTDGNQRLDGARVSHRRTHPDRVAEESMWKEKKEQEVDEIQKKIDTERKSKMFMIFSPCNGEMGDLAENQIAAKEKGFHYPGVIVTPADDKIYAPMNGRISWKTENPNKITIESDTGVEISLCVMKEDNLLQSEVFTMKSAEGAYIGVGEQLCQFTQGTIRKGNRAYQVKMELSSYQEGQLLLIKRFNYVSHGDKVMTLRTERNTVETA